VWVQPSGSPRHDLRCRYPPRRRGKDLHSFMTFVCLAIIWRDRGLQRRVASSKKNRQVERADAVCRVPLSSSTTREFGTYMTVTARFLSDCQVKALDIF